MKTALFIISLFSVSAVVQANQGAMVHTAIMQPPSFEDVDANKDGVISEDEAIKAKALSKMDFSAADKDGNGLLSKNEYQQAVQNKSTTKQHKGS
jgi:hypothetical protein